MPARDPSGRPSKGGTYRPPKKAPPKRPTTSPFPGQSRQAERAVPGKSGRENEPGGSAYAPPKRPKKSPFPGTSKQARKAVPKRVKSEQQNRRLNRRLKRKRRVERAVERAESRVRKSALTQARRQVESAKPKDTDTHFGPLNIEAELEGRGLVSKAAKEVKKAATSELGRTALKSAGVPIPEGKLGKAAIRDIVDVPAQAIPSAYAVGAGLKEAAEGRPQRLQELGKQLKEHDPVALAVQGRFKEAAKEAEKHPVLTGLSASGVGSVASRGLGAGVRGAGSTLRHAPTKTGRKVGKKLRRAGSTKRAPRRLPGTAIRENRTYSKGLVGKTAQVAVERVQRRRSRKLRAKAKRTRDPARKVELRQEAALHDPRMVKPREVARRVDEREAMAEVRRRGHRSEALKATDKALPKKRADVALLLAQRTVKPTRESVAKFKRDIDNQIRSGNLSKSQKLAAKKLRRQLDDALRDKKLDLAKLQKIADEYSKIVRPRQKELVKRGILAPEQERMAKLVPYAVREMGAKFDRKRVKTAKQKVFEGLRDEERKTAGELRKATEDAAIARREAARLEGRAEVQATAARRAVRRGTRLGKRRTDLTKAQGERLMNALIRREDAERRLASARRGFDDARQRRKGAFPRKDERFERDVFRDSEGKVIRVEDIEAHMRHKGIDPDDVAYVTQAPGQGGARNFFTSWHEPKGITTGRRTGEATRKGAFEVNREVGRENVARQQGLIDAHNEYAEFVGENRYRKPGEKTDFATREEAAAYARDNLGDSPYEWRPVPTLPLFGRKDQSQALLDQADSQDVGLSTSVRGGIENALAGEGGGKYVLVPAVAADRLSKHSRLMGSTGTKLTRKIGRQFSGTVLTTSGFTWPVGNVLEASLRATINRAGPASLALGRKTIAELRKLDPKRAEELEARIGTGHLGAYELNNVHATSKVFQGTVFAPAAKATGAFFRAPGPKQVAQLWNGWTKAIFAGNGFIEHQFRIAQFGRHLRDQGYSPKRLALSEGTKAMSKAAEQAAKGMRGTNEQVAAGRFIRRAYGQYEAWSPEMRFTIAAFTPFVAWSLNAVKFVTSVLPKDHPVLTGMLASAERASEEWRNQMGLGKFIDGAAPNWMQPSIPVDGKLYPVGRYTPFGFWADPLEQGGSLLLPQINGLVLASKGLDWKGDPIGDYERSDDVPEGDRAKEIARVAAGSFIPFFGLSERVKEKGKGAFSPVKGYDYDKKTSAAFDQLERVTKAKEAIKAKRPNVDSDNPTPAYERLHRQERRLNERIHKLSKGKYGHKYKTDYEPSGSTSSSGGSGWDQFREGGAPKQKSGWDAYR